ncbi:signal peptidase I [Kineococcus sp. NUM-3379]
MSLNRTPAERLGGAVLTTAEAIATAVVVTAAGLLLGSMVPLALGWKASAIVSGSMEPRIRVGDVVVTSPVDPRAIVPGQVVMFPDPDGGARTIMHRVVEVTEDDRLVTRGDANQSADTTPVERSAVLGVGRIRVPWVGLPRLWFQTGDHAPLVGLAVLLTMATALLVPRGPASPGPRPGTAPVPAPGTTPPPGDGLEDFLGLDGSRDADADATAALVSLLAAPGAPRPAAGAPRPARR